MSNAPRRSRQRNAGSSSCAGGWRPSPDARHPTTWTLGNPRGRGTGGGTRVGGRCPAGAGSGVQTTPPPRMLPRGAPQPRGPPANSRNPEKGSPVSLQQVKELRHECSSGRNRHSSSRQTAALAPRQTAHRSDRKWKRKRPRALARALVNACRALGLRGIRVETHLTESLTELAAAWPSFGDRRVALLGGDGTLHAAANLPAGPAELAILPAGRANNVARALGVPLDLKVAAELAADGQPRWIDLINATTDRLSYRAVEGVSVGLHALARASYSAPNSADLAAAARSAFRATRAFDGVTLSVSSDGVPEVLAVGQLFVANLAFYAFGLRVAPPPSRTTVSSTWSASRGKDGRVSSRRSRDFGAGHTSAALAHATGRRSASGSRRVASRPSSRTQRTSGRGR